MSHTPGPWKADKHAISVWSVNAKIGGDAKVCDIRGWGYLTGKGHGALGLSHDEAVAIQTANARLIAAAPDLLEALRALVAAVDDPDADSLMELRNARKAIAKATGDAK